MVTSCTVRLEATAPGEADRAVARVGARRDVSGSVALTWPVLPLNDGNSRRDSRMSVEIARRLASPLRSSGRVSGRRDACRDAGGARRELCLLRRSACEIRSGARRACPLPIDPSPANGANDVRMVFWRTTAEEAPWPAPVKARALLPDESLKLTCPSRGLGESVQGWMLETL